MKKILILGLLMLSFGMAFSQIVTVQLAKGAKGVDSLVGAQTKYYYFSTTAPIKESQIYAIQASTVRSVITGTDSCQISFEVSIDNTNWHKFTGTTPKVVGGAVYKSGPDLTTTTTNGATLLVPSNCYFPYVRVKFQHYKAACNMYPKAWIVLKKIPIN